jgi:hypothetical protein
MIRIKREEIGLSIFELFACGFNWEDFIANDLPPIIQAMYEKVKKQMDKFKKVRRFEKQLTWPKYWSLEFGISETQAPSFNYMTTDIQRKLWTNTIMYSWLNK